MFSKLAVYLAALVCNTIMLGSCKLAKKTYAMQVFMLLAWGYLEAGDKPGPAMSCIHNLRKAQTEANDPAIMSFMAMKALCQLGKTDKAETELLSVVSCSQAPLSICLGAIKAMLQASASSHKAETSQGKSAGMAGIKAAIDLVQERFADQAEVPLQLNRLLLAQEKVSNKASKPLNAGGLLCTACLTDCLTFQL